MGGDCGDPGGHVLRPSPTCSPSTAPAPAPAAFFGKTPPEDQPQRPRSREDISSGRRRTRRQADSAAQTDASSRHSRVFLAGAARLRGKGSPPQGPLPLWSSPVTLSRFFSLFPTGRPARGFHQSLACSGPEYLDRPCSCALLSLLGSIWGLLQGSQGADGTLSWIGLSSRGSGAGCWQRCVENASLCDSGGGLQEECWGAGGS